MIEQFANEALRGKSPNTIKTYSYEIEQFSKWLEGAGTNLTDYAIVQILANTGVRVSELVALDLPDIEMTERKGQLVVRDGKGHKQRVIPLNAETRRAISKYLEERCDDEEALFLSNRGKRISVRSVQHLIEKHGFNVHALRHTFITTLVRDGKDIGLIQSLTGHSSADMILRYSAPTEEDKQEAVEYLYTSH